MKVYPAYNNTQIEWIGAIPVHWSISRIKTIINGITNGVWGDEPQGDDNDLICVRVADFNKEKLVVKDDNLTIRNIPPNQQKDRLLSQDDLLIEKSGGGDNNPVGKVIRFDLLEKAVCSNFIGKITPDNSIILPKFLLYYLFNLYSKAVNTRSIKQTTGIQNIDTFSYFNERISYPNLPEQNAIADFLDYKTSLIDNLIEKKQRQIELLQEHRTAIINQVVTKGLNLNVPMIDSKIPTICEIPSHWEVRRNKRMYYEINEKSTKGDEELLTVSHLTGITPRSQKQVFMFKAESHVGYKICHPDDLVINTMWAWMGALGISPLSGIVSPSYNVYRLNVDCIPKYFDYLYRTPAYIVEINRHSKGIWSSRLRLYPEYFFQMYSVLPPKQEQYQIVSFLDQITKEISLLIDDYEHQIMLLQEYRTTLISDVVTGKIDVRGILYESNNL